MSEQEIADKAKEHSESFTTGSFFENIRYQSFEDGATWMQEEKDKEIAEFKKQLEEEYHKGYGHGFDRGLSEDENV